MERLPTACSQFNQTTFEARSIYVFLVFMMVSYVFLVSTAVQPWICFEDADGRLYLTADPTVNCKSCEFEDDIPEWLGGYDGLKVLSAISLVIYGLAIPGTFFWIVHTHKEEVKSGTPSLALRCWPPTSIRRHPVKVWPRPAQPC